MNFNRNRHCDFRFDNFPEVLYNNLCKQAGQPLAKAERPRMRKVRAPQGKNNG